MGSDLSQSPPSWPRNDVMSVYFRDRRWIVQSTSASDKCALTTFHLLYSF